jgi:hypothetical protein
MDQAAIGAMPSAAFGSGFPSVGPATHGLDDAPSTVAPELLNADH